MDNTQFNPMFTTGTEQLPAVRKFAVQGLSSPFLTFSATPDGVKAYKGTFAELDSHRHISLLCVGIDRARQNWRAQCKLHMTPKRHGAVCYHTCDTLNMEV